MASCSALLIDANNVRGVTGWPQLGEFVLACRRYATHRLAADVFVLIACDHGSHPAAYKLDSRTVVTFAGPHTDADTVLVHAVDWLLRDARPEVAVVTSDRMLLRRCQFGLPELTADDPWYERHGLRAPINPEFDSRGLRRPETQRSRLVFHSNMAFGQLLKEEEEGEHQEKEEAPKRSHWYEAWARWLVRWVIAAETFEPAEPATYRTRRAKCGKVLAKPTRRRKRSSSNRPEPSGARIHAAAELQAEMANSYLACSKSASATDDDATTCAASFEIWFASDESLRRCTRMQTAPADGSGNAIALACSKAAGRRRMVDKLAWLIPPLLLGLACLALAVAGGED